MSEATLDGPEAQRPETPLPARVAWEKLGGLLPVIVQHALSGAVLMLGYMNREALEATLERGRVVFFSRSRGRLWEKGETSGHHLSVVRLRLDCDADTLLVTALPAGPVCHTGTATCFGDEPLSAAQPLAFLATLEGIIAQRIAAQPEGSYTARLHAAGMPRVAQKVGEEAVEVALAAVTASDESLLGECADLLYHLLVLLRERSLDLSAVVRTLQRRHATPPT
ncbi:MAG TPA: bifunctional phosphoribosyl-AMP cyclohydrolase/phosphoribosyl-ATP diphosphatase HisIE [Steroidobacteraceae bacterium]|nr:bifunctional phosphoribosyl-AMP cyclohydrolase/phosphoribosyl-ATP diphosphatase HisIE [Steroidobacteraceae bacterium]